VTAALAETTPEATPTGTATCTVSAPATTADLITIRQAGGTITLRPAPRREPPFDDERDPTEVAGPHDRRLPFDTRQAPEGLRPTTRAMSPLRATLPDPSGWGRRLLLGIIETAGGKRPLHQLAPLLSQRVARGISADFERSAHLGNRHWTHSAIVRTVRASEPADGVAELSATLRAGPRVRAIAMRLEVRNGRWCCTRLILG
jgi:hypothetical protein